MSDDSDKEALLRLLLEAERTHASLQEQGQHVVGMSQSGRDHARITHTLVSKVPLPKAEIERFTELWRQQNDAVRAMTHELKETLTVYGVASHATSLGTSTAVNNIIFTMTGEQHAAEQQRAVVGDVITDLIALVQREGVFEKVRDAFLRCRLDKGQGDHRSPLSLIEDGRLALEQPSGLDTSPTAALVPLRQSIERTILDLFTRCAGQEPASSWKDKVLSIGRRCSKVSVPNGHFERLADVIERKMNQLSGAKDKVMRRDHVLVAYYDGLNFLATLLDGIDDNRLR